MMSRVLLFTTPMLMLCMALANSHALANANHELSSRRSMSGQYYDPRGSMTCDQFPRVCHANGSPGPDCCGKRCVNVMVDSLNCGECGRRCQYGQACCGGNCVNTMYDAKNCGGCKKRCKNGDFCKYGMCSYA